MHRSVGSGRAGSLRMWSGQGCDLQNPGGRTSGRPSAPLRTDAAPIGCQSKTDDQHPDHQLGINRGAPGVAIEGGEVLPQLAQIHEAVNAAQQMIDGYVVFKIERVEQRRLARSLASHHVPPHPPSFS